MTQSTSGTKAIRETIIQRTLGLEGGYSDHPHDRGGKTRYGITERVARRHGYDGAMSALPLPLALSIYEDSYWKPLDLDAIATYSESIAEELFDTGVNSGVARAAEFFQCALNALNRQGQDYLDLTVDGDIGPATLGAFGAYVEKRGAEGMRVLSKCLNCLQGAFFIALSERRQTNEAFLYGWIKNRVG